MPEEPEEPEETVVVRVQQEGKAGFAFGYHFAKQQGDSFTTECGERLTDETAEVVSNRHAATYWSNLGDHLRCGKCHAQP